MVRPGCRVGYYIRVFAKSDSSVPATWLRRDLDHLGWDAVIEHHGGTQDCWKSIVVAHGDGGQICFVEREEVSPGSLATREVQDYLVALADYRPQSGAEWVREFLARVRVIYPVRVQTCADTDPAGRAVMQFIIAEHSRRLDGITHAESEGFYIKENSYLVAAEPDAERIAPDDGCVVAVRQDDGWTAFHALPGDGTFAAFLRGEVPEGVESWPVT
jgi:hypothetical protein